jgi:hypothetical protein
MKKKKNCARTLVPALPLLREPGDAEALFKETNDPFYLAAFMIQFWLGGLVQRTAAEYAEKKHPRDRSLQRGEAWQSFSEIFRRHTKGKLRFILPRLLRFCASDSSPRNLLRQALVPLAIEHQITGNYYFGPKKQEPGTGDNRENRDAKKQETHFPLSPVKSVKTLKDQAGTGANGANRDSRTGAPQFPPLSPVKSSPPVELLCRGTIMRWCDWLDAAIHQRIHRHWHLAPECFDPDPETRHLANLGHAQSNLARLDERAKACWLLDFAAAADHFQDSPKWSALGQALNGDSTRSWIYPELDALVIALWPLVSAHNWTYRDLLNVIRPALERPTAYPCDTEQNFATHCRYVLGLQKVGRGKTARDGRPAGYDVARKLCPALGAEGVEGR